MTYSSISQGGLSLMSKSAFSSVPQPRAYPFVGNAPSIDIDAPVQSMMRLAQDLGPVYRLQFPSQPALVVGEYRLVEELSDPTRFEKIVHAPLRQLRDLGGDALFTADNDDPAWAIAHRLLMPAFGAPAMRRYWADMVDITDQLVTKWERLGPGIDHDVADNMTRLTLDTIALSGFSYRFNSYYQREMHPFVDSMVRALGEAGTRSRRFALQSRLMLVTRRQYERDLTLMYDVVDEVIRERKSQPKSDGAPKDLLDLMLADGALTDVQIRFQIMTIRSAGTTPTRSRRSRGSRSAPANAPAAAAYSRCRKRRSCSPRCCGASSCTIPTAASCGSRSRRRSSRRTSSCA